MDDNNADSPVTDLRAPTHVGSKLAPSRGVTTNVTGVEGRPTGNEKVQAGFNFDTLIKNVLDASKFHGTLLVFAFVILKVLMVAKADMFTALAIINASGIVSVVVGAVLSTLPYLTAGLFIIGVYRFAAHKLEFPALTTKSVVALGMVFLAVVLLVPWPVVLSGLFTFYLGRRSERLGLKLRAWRMSRRQRRIIRVLLILLALSPLSLVVQDSLFVMWLPREELHLRDDRIPLVGYVLEDREGWMSVLTSQERKVFRIDSERVDGRVLCRKNHHESIGLLSYRVLTKDPRVPLCYGAKD